MTRTMVLTELSTTIQLNHGSLFKLEEVYGIPWVGKTTNNLLQGNSQTLSHKDVTTTYNFLHQNCHHTGLCHHIVCR